MSEQILASGADHGYAAALDWIRQAAGSGTKLALRRDEEPAEEELVSALLPIIPSEHATAIVAQQIREKLTTPRRGPANGTAAAAPGTLQYADPYSARCPDCDNPAGPAAEARRLLGRWAE